MGRRLSVIFLLVAMLACETLIAQEAVPSGAPASESSSRQALFEKMTGKWSGSCKTWFEPGKLADDALVQGEFTPVMGGRFLRHTYQGSIQGKPRKGEEMIARNAVTGLFQSSWVDDFHMNYAILFSQGPATERGFQVTGEYDVGKDQPRWGWRTEYELKDDDHLVITAFNIQPDGTEARAVETTYRRAPPANPSRQ